MQATTLDYLRHGEPVGGARFRGNGVDDPLSELGWSQMRHSAAAVTGWQAVVSSPLQRCRAFAETLAADRGLGLEVLDDLREVGFGSWEGQDREALEREQPDAFRAFYRDPVNRRPPGAEPLVVFGQRVAAVFDALAQRYAGQHVLVVAHAGVIRATLGHILQAAPVNWYRTEVAYAAITRLGHGALGPRLVHHNWRPTL